jgi:deoxyhypusine synthase
MSLASLSTQMEAVKVLGPGRFGKAVRLLGEIFSDKNSRTFISLAGPMIPGGLRTVITDLVKEGLLDAIVSTGANVTHDMLEGLGHRHIVGSETMNDRVLKRKGLSRIYDLLVEQKAIEDLERRTYQMLDQVDVTKRRDIASYELLWEFGRQLGDKQSLLYNAQKRQVPVFCPGIFDSMLGLNLWTYSRLKPLFVNPFRDFSRLVEMTYEAKRTSAIILGGGMPKHHVLIANSYRGGVDTAIQITLDRPEGGGASGAPLEEAISWGKIKNYRRLVTITGDAAVMFPILTAAALERTRP